MIYTINNLLSYKSDRSQNPKNICVELKKIIDQVTLDKDLRKIIDNLRGIFDIPINILEFDVKKKFFLSFQFSLGQFSRRFKMSYLIKDLFYLLMFFLWASIFSKKLKIKQQVDIIFDDLDNLNQIEFFKKLSSKFKNHCFIIKKKVLKRIIIFLIFFLFIIQVYQRKIFLDFYHSFILCLLYP